MHAPWELGEERYCITCYEARLGQGPWVWGCVVSAHRTVPGHTGFPKSFRKVSGFHSIYSALHSPAVKLGVFPLCLCCELPSN